MRRAGIKASAFSTALLLACGCVTAGATDRPTDYELLAEACFEGAPTFSAAEGAALRAGGTPDDDREWATSTQLESPNVVAAWTVPATGLPDKIAGIAIFEGEYGGRHARSCNGGQSAYARPELEDRLSARFDLQLVRREPIYPIGFVRTTYSANLNGSHAIVVTEGAGGGGFPRVEVIILDDAAA